MTVHIIEITNPFQPHSDAVHSDIEAGHTILGWLRSRNPGFVEFDRPTVCTVNARPLLRAEWQTYVMQDDDIVQFVALAGEPLTIFYVVAAIVSIGTAIYTLANLPKPRTPGQTPEASPVYSLAGQQNQVRLQNPIEVPYGRVRLWPSYAARPYNKYIDNEQFLYQLFCLGQGQYDIEGVFIEDTPIDNFQEVEYEFYGPGDAVTLFANDVVTSVEVANIELKGTNESGYDWSGPFVANPANTTTTSLEIDIVFPAGLYYSNDEGGLDSLTVTAVFEYRPIDNAGSPTGSWATLATISKTLATVTPQRFTVAATVSSGRYEVRAHRTNDKNTSARAGNTMQWGALRAILPETTDFGAVTLLAVKIRATNNLNDQSSSRMNVVATRMLPTWDGDSWTAEVATRSPVWAFCDVFRNAIYGGRLPDNYLDMTALAEMDALLDGLGIYFDWVFEQRTSVWEAATAIARVGRCSPLLNGSRITMVRDEAKTLPVAVFNAENIVEGSFRWDIKLFEVGNNDSVEVEYIDPTTWKQETIICALPDGTYNNPEQIKLAGCTDRDWAYREGLYLAAAQKYSREKITFQTGLEGYIPTFGDLISVVHDIPRWGKGGYVVGIRDTTVQLSVPVTFGDGTHYIVLRNKDGSAAGPYLVTAGGADDVVVLATTIPNDFFFDYQHEPPYFQFGAADEWARLCLVRGIRPQGDTIEIECAPYDARMYEFDEEIAPPVGSIGQPLIPALPVVHGLRVLGIPDVKDFVVVTWVPALGARRYILQQSFDNVNWVLVDSIRGNSYTLPVKPGALYLRVAGVNTGQGPWSTASATITSDAIDIPYNVYNFYERKDFDGAFHLGWQRAVSANYYRLRIYDADDVLLRTLDLPGLLYDYTVADMLDDGLATAGVKFTLVGVNTNGESETPAELNLTRAYDILIDTALESVNLKTLFESRFGAPFSGAVVTFTIDSGIPVIGATTSDYALTNPSDWPADCDITLVISGKVVGRGGAGGNGDKVFTGSGTAPTDGQDGGSAMLIEYPITIDNTAGIIGSGGGGGGGGGIVIDPGGGLPYVSASGGGGGGGAGAGVGGDGGDYPGQPDAEDGQLGGDSTGGAGGLGRTETGSTTSASRGGAGGDLGQPGEDGYYDTSAGTGLPVRGVGGNAGAYAVNGNSFITWIDVGTIYGTVA